MHNVSTAVTSLYKWFGAVIYYFLNLGQVPFDQLYSEKYKWRNVWLGYGITMMFLISGILYLVL